MYRLYVPVGTTWDWNGTTITIVYPSGAIRRINTGSFPTLLVIE